MQRKMTHATFFYFFGAANLLSFKVLIRTMQRLIKIVQFYIKRNNIPAVMFHRKNSYSYSLLISRASIRVPSFSYLFNNSFVRLFPN